MGWAKSARPGQAEKVAEAWHKSCPEDIDPITPMTPTAKTVVATMSSTSMEPSSFVDEHRRTTFHHLRDIERSPVSRRPHVIHRQGASPG